MGPIPSAAHVDAGKSTLSDRLLELTGTISPREGHQVLDKLKVERDRGITVKASSSSMIYERTDGRFLLNLIDTPGHIDFASEVHRSLLACQGALLMIDATSGVQSQTLTVFNAARQCDNIKALIGVINKVDLPHAETEMASHEVARLLHCHPADNLLISAKNGMGITDVLDAIVDRIPYLPADVATAFEALVFDSHFDVHRGVISIVAVLGGRVTAGDKVSFRSLGSKRWEVSDVGILFPDLVSTPTGLRAGQVGYLMCAMRNESDARIGDVVHAPNHYVSSRPAFEPLKPVVFASFYPVASGAFSLLEDAIKRLILTDRSLTCQRESSAALGRGFRLGFLGALHLDVIRQRLVDEYRADVVVTRPFVPIRVLRADGKHYDIVNPQDWPDVYDFSPSHPNAIVSLEEPVVAVTVAVPENLTSAILALCTSCRGRQASVSFPPNTPLASESTPMVAIAFTLPLSSLVTRFHARLQAETSGLATLTYSSAGYGVVDLVKIVLLLQGQVIEPLSLICHRTESLNEGRKLVERLRNAIDRQMTEIYIQASLDGRVIAKDSIKPYRKNVLQGITRDRKLKHLRGQKKGLQSHERQARVLLSPDAYKEILKEEYTSATSALSCLAICAYDTQHSHRRKR